MPRNRRDPAEAHAYLAAIINSSDDIIISKDLNGNITSWNPAAEHILGYTQEEAIGKHISIIIPPDRLGEEEYILGKIERGERVDPFEAVRRAKNGKEVYLSVTVSPIKNEQGQIVGASKVARDISGVKEAERTRAYLGAIVESSDDAIISKNLNGIITSWNSSAERIFGFKPEEIIGRHITALIPADRLPEEDAIISQLKEGKRIEHFETMRRTKDGTLLPVSLTVSPILDSAGNIIGASKVARDISERINAQKALVEMARKKDEFLANMSHELRTPMNAVIGLTNLLMNSKTISERDRKYVETLKLSSDNLMELINDLLDFSRIDSDSMELEHIEFSLPEEIEKVIRVMNVRAQEKGIALYASYDPTLARGFVGDPLRIHQILTNLVSNAIKFTEEGLVEMVVGGETKEDGTAKVIIHVRDTGIGIAEDKQDMIFDKFTQADASMTRRFGGSGLGLAITKGLIDCMGGTIEVRSELKIGTTFTVTLPLKISSNAQLEASFSVNASPLLVPKPHRNVLLVEDHEANVMVTGAMLDQADYDYEVAENGTEALRKFIQGSYDVILMDVQMPELDGFNVTKHIRVLEEENGLARTPIIAMTAHVREQDKSKCLEAGMDDFIPKPFEPERLLQKVARYINRRNDVVIPFAGGTT